MSSIQRQNAAMSFSGSNRDTTNSNSLDFLALPLSLNYGNVVELNFYGNGIAVFQPIKKKVKIWLKGLKAKFKNAINTKTGLLTLICYTICY